MRRILLALATSVLLTACSSGNGNGTNSTMQHADTTPTATQPPVSAADRTVTVTATDRLRFQPASISVRQGETVAFRVTNAGNLAHEFVIGDQAFQDRHDKQMQGMQMPMGDDADGIALPARATKTFVYTFRQAGTLYYACHVSGHYQAGMKGTVMAA